MTPAPGERRQRFVGDTLRFELRDVEGRMAPGWRALLRTNLGRAEVLRNEVLQAHTKGLPLAGASWRDIPMQPGATGWHLDLPLSEPGFFKAKAYLLDPNGWQHWPSGPDAGISVHPDRVRTGNIMYSAFPRLFGRSRFAQTTRDPKLSVALAPLDEAGFAVLPPSGKLRDLTAQVPHIVDKLGCRILQLLPVNPTPTTYARFGRYGSPYAALNLTAIDPALVEFDKKSTGVDQFRELTYAMHAHGGRVFLDMVINHTGWGSDLQENHPEWFIRQPDGTFVSPGAWGTIWEDLVELRHAHVALWDELAEVFLTWCRRGVDGFRCDAGYKVPLNAWHYIINRVQQEYPETIFFLEGLGGAWEATESLLTEGGMQWAYSELFQNYSGLQISGYLDHSNLQTQRVGLMVHISETHDNERLAARGRRWSLLRNRLCALASSSGGFGFTCGAEWLAAEKISVHGCSGLAWDNPDNLVPELQTLSKLLLDHPCFFDGAAIRRLSEPGAPIYAFSRQSADLQDWVIVLINTELEKSQTATIVWPAAVPPTKSWTDLLCQELPPMSFETGGMVRVTLAPGAAFCLSPTQRPISLHGEDYRNARARAAWAITTASQVLPAEKIGGCDWQVLAQEVDTDPAAFLSALASLCRTNHTTDFVAAIRKACAGPLFPSVVEWSTLDAARITPVPPGFWVLIRDNAPFRASLDRHDGRPSLNLESIPAAGKHIACLPPSDARANASLLLECYGKGQSHVRAKLRFIGTELPQPPQLPQPADIALLTNGRGGMVRMAVDLGRINSKYDCALGANLHPAVPVDRHVLVKRIRVWINADGFITPLDYASLVGFQPGPPAVWDFIANAGDGRVVQVQLAGNMASGRNTTVFRIQRPTQSHATGKQLPDSASVQLVVRVDIEDRGFHSETHRNPGSEHHFQTHCAPLREPETRRLARGGAVAGFAFTPAPDRQLRVYADSGKYHHQAEWSENIPHPLEQSRGQVGCGDAYSPGWFEIPLSKGGQVHLILDAEPSPIEDFVLLFGAGHRLVENRGEVPADDAFGRKLLNAIPAFVVGRDRGKTVIAGYPWFLDWGRDTFIAARGLIAAGWEQEVGQMLTTFARFERNGTLPNVIFGEDASNRDTSDAPLWFGVVCEELAEHYQKIGQSPAALYSLGVDYAGRTLHDVLRSIASHYLLGTPNGIQVDAESGLVWSPSHFTWMDTNYPACTPRAGYPIEIQALWIRLLRQLARIGGPTEPHPWEKLANQAQASLEKLFWLEPQGFYSDLLAAPAGIPASRASVDDALRSNCLFVISLGLSAPDRARRCVQAALRYLIVPGALRSLAPLPVNLPLPNTAADGRLLNDPCAPYWGHYEGDEDTRRKPAYHNGTAWTWTFPTFCEALAAAWDWSPEAVSAAKAYLRTMNGLLDEGCLGHLPEITDGDVPHQQRGCDAQGWSVTEAMRVWLRLGNAQAK